MSGPRRLLLSGIALTALLALVAVASRAHHPGGGSGAAPKNPPHLVFDYLATSMFVLLPVGAVICVLALFHRRHEALRQGRTNWRRTLALFMVSVPFLVLVSLLARKGWFHHSSHPALTNSAPALQQSSVHGKGSQPFYQAQFRWLPVLVLGSIAVVVGAGVGTAYVRKWRGGGELDRQAALAVALDEVLADTLDDLRAERDPRRAVIRTYARMERTFAAYDVPRQEAETPQEYFERVLDTLQVSEYSMRRLTQLFARARFSEHEIDPGMKDDAIDALGGLRVELEHRPEAVAAA